MKTALELHYIGNLNTINKRQFEVTIGSSEYKRVEVHRNWKLLNIEQNCKLLDTDQGRDCCDLVFQHLIGCHLKHNLLKFYFKWV